MALGAFILGLALLAGLLVGGRALVTMEPRVLANVLRAAGVVVAGAAGLFFFVRGQIGFGSAMLAAAGALSMTLIRGRSGARSSASTVETASVRMTLDHASGDMDGEVLRGPYEDKRLSELTRPEIEEILATALNDDPDAAALLHAYLERRFGQRSSEGARDAGEGAQAGGPMTRAEALNVLGLQEGADADDIRAAHRRLMKAIHPDAGGSGWLAAQINQAKEVLLGGG